MQKSTIFPIHQYIYVGKTAEIKQSVSLLNRLEMNLPMFFDDHFFTQSFKSEVISQKKGW